MGCIELTIAKVGETMSAMASRLDELVFEAMRSDEQMAFTCGLVCSANDVYFLNVEPEFIWLLPENDFSEDVAVYSNVAWTIE